MVEEELLKKMEQEEGFFHHNNYQVVKADKEEVILKGSLVKNAMNPYDMAHGGFIFGLGDTAMGILVRVCGRRGVTLSSNINFLHPGTGEYITAKGKLIKQGKKTCYTRADIYDNEDHLIATMDANYYFID